MKASIGLFAPLLMAAAAPSFAAPKVPAPRVVLAVDGIEQSRNLPALLAERLGYFRHEGLTVTLVDAPADPSPAKLMADGRADGAIAFYHHTFMNQTDDHLVTQSVVLMGTTPQLKLIVAARLRDRVHGLADLRGLRIITGGKNSGKTTTMNWLALKSGIGVGGYTPLPLAKRDAMAAALRSGTADAIIAHEPDASGYVREGAGFQLADLTSATGTQAALGSVYPSTALYLPQAYVSTHRDTVQHLVNACLRAMRFIRTHSAEQIASIVPPRARGSDSAGYVRLIAEDKHAFDGGGRMPAEAARAELAAMAALQPKYRAVRIELTYTNDFVAHAPPARGDDTPMPAPVAKAEEDQ